jgi:hypothetical protein
VTSWVHDSSTISIVGTPEPDPRTVHGDVAAAVSQAWAKSDVFVTSLPSVRLSDPAQLGRKKMRAVKAALEAWPEVSGAVRAFASGNIRGLSPRHPCLLILGESKQLDPCSGLTSLGLWAPPGGWEDLVLACRGRVLGWSSTHDRISAFAASLLEPGKGSVPKFAVDVRVEGTALGPELTAELLNT